MVCFQHILSFLLLPVPEARYPINPTLNAVGVQCGVSGSVNPRAGGTLQGAERHRNYILAGTIR